MSSSTNCLCMSYRSCFGLFFILNILTIGSMIATLFIKEWVSVELSSSTTFEGGLKQLYEPEDKTHEEYSDDICDLYDSAKDLYEYGLIPELLKNKYESEHSS